jgi:chromosome segregation ATPase
MNITDIEAALLAEGALASADTDTPETENPVATPQAPQAASTDSTAEVAELKAQYAEVEAKLKAAETELAEVKASLSSAEATHKDAVAKTFELVSNTLSADLKSRSVALGLTAQTYDSIESLCAAHADIREKFLNKFKQGRQSAPAAQAAQPNPQATTMSPVYFHIVRGH